MSGGTAVRVQLRQSICRVRLHSVIPWSLHTLHTVTMLMLSVAHWQHGDCGRACAGSCQCSEQPATGYPAGPIGQDPFRWYSLRHMQHAALTLQPTQIDSHLLVHICQIERHSKTIEPKVCSCIICWALSTSRTCKLEILIGATCRAQLQAPRKFSLLRFRRAEFASCYLQVSKPNC